MENNSVLEFESTVTPILETMKIRNLAPVGYSTTQRHNDENSKQLFPEKELRGYSSNFYIMFMWAIYILPWSVCLFCCRKIHRWTDPWGYIFRSQTHECGNWDWGRTIPFLGIHKSKFFKCSRAVHYIWALGICTYELLCSPSNFMRERFSLRSMKLHLWKRIKITCIQYTNSTGKGGGGNWTKEKVRGATVHKAGLKIPSRLTVSPIYKLW